MNYFLPKNIDNETRLYIANEDEVSCAYLTLSQVKRREDLKDYIPAMKLLQSDIETKKYKRENKKEARKKLLDTLKRDSSDDHLPF